MTQSEALTKSAFLNDLCAIPGLGSKAVTESILLRIHYRKAVDEWLSAQKIIAETDADNESKQKAVETKLAEESTITDKRMTREAFEQVVEAALKAGSIKTFLLIKANSGEAHNVGGELPAIEWLTSFAANMVES